jgi:hypothetical protein
MSRVENLKNAVGEAIKSYENKNITEDIFAIKGFSGKEYKLFANKLLEQPIVKNYLEIGVWHGSTSIAALKNNTQKLNYWVVDNFSQFGSPKQEFINNWKNYIGSEPNLIDEDCFKINLEKKGLKDIDVYFYDGDHEEKDHYLALQYYYPAMADSFIFMVDDWCWPKVQIGTFNAIRDLNLKTEMHVGFYGNEDSNGWWNGCGIFIFKK